MSDQEEIKYEERNEHSDAFHAEGILLTGSRKFNKKVKTLGIR